MTAPWALEEDHQPAGDPQCQVTPLIVFNQLQCEVDPRRDPCRCPERAVLHIDLIGHDLGGREPLGQFGCVLPVRCRVFAVEQPGRSEEESARADGPMAASLRRSSPQPFVQPGARIGLCVVRCAGK